MHLYLQLMAMSHFLDLVNIVDCQYLLLKLKKITLDYFLLTTQITYLLI